MRCQNPLQGFKMLTYCILNCGNFCWILKTTKPTSFDKLILFYIHRRIQRRGGAKEVVPSRSNLFFQFHAVFRENGKNSRLMQRDRKLVHPPGNHGSTTRSMSLFSFNICASFSVFFLTFFLVVSSVTETL